MRLLKILKIDSPYYPAIPFLGRQPKDSTCYYRDTWSSMFTDGLFMIARKWKQSKCLSIDEWIIKMWYIHAMG